MVKLKVGDAVEFVRSKPPTAPATTTKKKGKATDGKLIHFRKPAADGKGASLDVGRLPNTVADWASPLMAHDLVRLSGTVVECPKDFTTGSTILLSLRVEIARSAFASTEVTTIDDDVVPIDGPPPAKKHRRNSSPSSIVVGTADDWKGAGGSSKPKPAKKGGEGTKTQAKLKFDATSSQGGKKGGKDTSRKGAGFFQDLKETDREVALRERKSSLNKLFDALNLRPISTAKSKRNMLDSFDPAAERKLREELDGKDKGGKAKDKDAKGKKPAVRRRSLDGTDRTGQGRQGQGQGARSVGRDHRRRGRGRRHGRAPGRQALHQGDQERPQAAVRARLGCVADVTAKWTRPRPSSSTCGRTSVKRSLGSRRKRAPSAPSRFESGRSTRYSRSA